MSEKTVALDATAVVRFMRAAGIEVRNMPGKGIHADDCMERLARTVTELEHAWDHKDEYQICENAANIVWNVLAFLASIGYPSEEILSEFWKARAAAFHPDDTVKFDERGMLILPQGWKPPQYPALLQEQVMRCMSGGIKVVQPEQEKHRE